MKVGERKENIFSKKMSKMRAYRFTLRGKHTIIRAVEAGSSFNNSGRGVGQDEKFFCKKMSKMRAHLFTLRGKHTIIQAVEAGELVKMRIFFVKMRGKHTIVANGRVGLGED